MKNIKFYPCGLTFKRYLYWRVILIILKSSIIQADKIKIENLAIFLLEFERAIPVLEIHLQGHAFDHVRGQVRRRRGREKERGRQLSGARQNGAKLCRSGEAYLGRSRLYAETWWHRYRRLNVRKIAV